MAITTLTSEELHQDTARAVKATEDGPVFITDRGEPAYVLLSIEQYQRLTVRPSLLIENLGQPPGVEDIEFDPPRLNLNFRPADFS